MPALVSKPLPRRRESDALNVRFVTAKGDIVTAQAAPGARLLEVGQAAGMPLEGTCEGQMACSTCHVVVLPEWFEKLEPASPDEEDMLDLAAGVTRTSRLSCQIELSGDMDGLTVQIPGVARDMQFG
jgi:ferredoxin